MSPWQAVATVLLGNAIVLVPMLLIGHAGAKYGIPYAVLVRSSFGTQGAKLPALLRAIVACGWYGIQTWFGGLAMYTLLNILTGNALLAEPIGWLGINAGQLGCFLAFWALQLWFVVHGTDSIRWLETFSAPVKIVMCFVLVGWAVTHTGGFGAMMSQPSAFEPGGAKEGMFWAVFWPSLTAMVGFWATLALNIPDFTRFAKSQRDQLVGQTIGLPAPMGLLALMSVVVTSATVVVYGKAIWDPVDLASRMTGAAVLVAAVLFMRADFKRKPFYGGIALEQLRPAPAGDSFVALPSPAVVGHLVPRALVVFDFASRPLVLSHGSEQLAVVGRQAFLQVGASLALWDRLLVGVNLPVALVQGGDSPSVASAQKLTFSSPTSAQIGDLRVARDLQCFQGGFQIHGDLRSRGQPVG